MLTAEGKIRKSNLLLFIFVPTGAQSSGDMDLLLTHPSYTSSSKKQVSGRFRYLLPFRQVRHFQDSIIVLKAVLFVSLSVIQTINLRRFFLSSSCVIFTDNGKCI